MADYPAKLINSFEILDEIEFGAYGLIKIVKKRSIVYLDSQKLYAMKIENRSKSKGLMKYMESELEVLFWIFPYKLHSDYYFEDNHNAYIIIDYCENGDLLKEIENKSTINQHFEEDEIWKYFIQICFGLEFLNSRGFIHHNLHPKNIFLDENKDIKLGDFGISHYIDDNKDWSFWSIFSWMTKGESKEGDVWAAGCVLYYLLTLEGNLNREENYMLIIGNYSDEIKSFTDWCLRENRNERPTINQILTHDYIVNKTINLGIAIPRKSVMRTIYNPIEEIKEIVYPQIPLLKSINKVHENRENNILTIQELKEKTVDILNRPIDSELERDFRRICLIYASGTSMYDQSLIHAYQDYVNTYIQHISLYKTIYNNQGRHLVTYNAENERKEVKELETPKIIDYHTCIAKLPGGKLFCFTNANISGVTMIIDENGRIERLPSGSRCWKTSLIYFNSSVYRFGGLGLDEGKSERFDLLSHHWFKLPQMPKTDYYFSNGIIFNNNFLLPGVKEKNILIFSSDIESYSVIPYEFAEDTHKILIHAEKRLYLIELGRYGSVSESEVEDEYNWKRIMANKHNIFTTSPSCSLYYKGDIYIGCCKYESEMLYYKFSLDEKYWTPF